MTNANEDLVRKIVAIFATCDLSPVNEVISESYLDHRGLGGGEIRGQDGCHPVVNAARRDLLDLRVDLEDMAEDDGVAARLRWHGTRSNGERVDRETIDIVRFESGRAGEHWGTRLEILPEDFLHFVRGLAYREKGYIPKGTGYLPW
jgi:predicted ester cyclase